MKPIVLQLWYVILIAWAAASASAGTEEVAATSMALPGCKDKCGNVSVPYPFGIDDSKCSKNESYLLNCTVEASLDSSPRLMMGNIQLMNIFVENGTSIVNIFMAYNCYNKSTNKMDFYDHEVNLTGAPFMFSATEIKFTEIGCNTLAFIADSEGTRFGSGCLSLCSQDLQEGSCNGVGCCRTEIPTRLKTLEMSIAPVNDTYDQSFRPCSYAFLAHQNWSGYWSINLSDTAHVTREAPVVLDWVVGDETCQSLDQSPSKSACGPNSDCHDSVNGPGYRCICKSGYHGNPYLPEGCQDINECENQNEYHCEGKCDNIPGNYTCHCPLGMYGNGKVACKGFRITTIVGVCAAGVTLVVLFIFLWMELRRRNKMKCFRKNGGLLLKHQKVRIFREAELERATNNYDAPRLLGQGGSATVYKGVLEDNSVVAIKKPKETERTQNKHLPLEVIIEQFQHEINILFQVNHINVVKLLGLCLETKIPLLVYEFVSNGSLYDHIHVKRSTTLRSWVNCLKIAAESALALDYLHSLADPPVIHGDVKSMNILLDDKFTAKVADFGTSVLISLDQSVETKINGTPGYMDPEYLNTGILTVKSDVYSFGVVLMELLTGQKPVSNQRSGEKANFIQYFMNSVKQKKLSQVLSFGEDDSGEMDQIEAVAELARRCLNRSGMRRPTMKEVAEKLLSLKKRKNFGAKERGEEMESLLGGERLNYANEENDTMFYTSTEVLHMTALDIERK